MYEEEEQGEGEDEEKIDKVRYLKAWNKLQWLVRMKRSL